MTSTQHLSLPEARRIALAAQQFGTDAAPLRTVRALATSIARLGAVQIDSVNVLIRSHYLPLFSRYGAYPRELLERAAYASSGRKLFEYWGHEASFLPVETFPLFRWRMQRAHAGEGTWQRLKRYATEHKALADAVVRQIREQGPLRAGAVIDGGRSTGSWWGWSQGKEILEWLFWTGVVTTTQRRQFERVYDLTERVLPASILATETPAEEAYRRLMMIAARAHGVATLRDLRDYFRLPTAAASTCLAELVAAGALEPVQVEGWKQQAYLHPKVVQPRKVAACSLLSPFDSLIWERQRTERLFDFRYRLEIYTPAHQREHGYYVLPFLCGERIVGRVDLKANREASRLEVRGGSVEAGVKLGGIVAPLAAQLAALAAWLGLERYQVTSRRGELMRAVRQVQPPLRAHQPKPQVARKRTK